MTKQNKTTKATKATKATNEQTTGKTAADLLSETKEKVLTAFKEAVKGEKTLTTVAVEAVANYYIANKRIVSDQYVKEFSKEWKKAGFSTKYQSGVFYRVLMTLKKNEGIVISCAKLESVKKGEKTLADSIRDRCLAEKLGLTTMKTLAEINKKKREDAEKRADRKATESTAPSEQATATESAPTEQATESTAPSEQATAPSEQATESTAPSEQATATESAPTEQATAPTDKLQKLLDFIAVCNESAFLAIKNAVAKREQVDRKLQATG